MILHIQEAALLRRSWHYRINLEQFVLEYAIWFQIKGPALYRLSLSVDSAALDYLFGVIKGPHCSESVSELSFVAY